MNEFELTIPEKKNVVANRIRGYEAQRYEQEVNIQLWESVPASMRNPHEKRQIEIAIEQLDKLIESARTIYQILEMEESNAAASNGDTPH